MLESLLPGGGKIILKTLRGLENGTYAQILADNGKSQPLKLRAVPWLLLDTIVGEQISALRLEERGQPGNPHAIRERLHGQGLIEHREEEHREMRIELQDGRIFDFKLPARTSPVAERIAEVYVHDGDRRTLSSTTGDSIIRIAVKLSEDGRIVADRLAGADLDRPTGAVAEKSAPNSSAAERTAPLTDTEQNLLEALGTKRMTGEALAKKAGYPFNSNLKTIRSEEHTSELQS